MKYTKKVIETLIENKLARLWRKNGIERLYIDLTAVDAWTANCDEFPGRFAVNRYDRFNGKMWIDLANDEIATRNMGHGEECTAQLDTIISILVPEETEATEDMAETAENDGIDEEVAVYVVMRHGNPGTLNDDAPIVGVYDKEEKALECKREYESKIDEIGNWAPYYTVARFALNKPDCRRKEEGANAN